MKELEKSLMNLIWSVGKFIKDPKFTEGCSHLNPAEAKLFEFIKPESKITMGELSNNLGYSKGATSLTVDKLVRKKIMTRLYDKNDRRIVYISLTKAGEKSYKAYMECKAKVLHSIIDSIKDYDQKLCVDIIDKIIYQLGVK